MTFDDFKTNTQQELPDKPGVYQFHGTDEILYIGKAKSLKKRVSSYFTNSKGHSRRILLLTRKAVKIHFTVVDTPHDALLLENSLIKKHQPRYNIQLRDDKTYPFICIKHENFPRVFLTRQIVKDGSEYLGPYTSVKRVRFILDFIRSVYQLRTCNLKLTPENIAKGKFKICLEYHIGNCKGPCEGHQEDSVYKESISEIKSILRGNVGHVIKELSTDMNKHAMALEFELANILKSKIDKLKQFQGRSTVVSHTITNVDVYAIAEAENQAFVNFFRVMNGTIVQAQALQLKKQMDESTADLLAYAILHFQEKFAPLPREIILPLEIEPLNDQVKIHAPMRGDKKHLLDLCYKNAVEYKNRILTRLDKSNAKKGPNRVLEVLKKDFSMGALPLHIECFDNSNFQGDNPVASCVVFKNGKPSKKDYRHFNIKTVEGPDDFASMREIVFRRYKRLLEENKSLPQLVIIDGGKGQLNAAMESFQALNLVGKVTVAGIAKKLEEIYFPGDPIPLHIDKRSEGLKLVQHLRNEAHRFAITFHRLKRDASTLKTGLTDIPGIGEKTANELLRHFRSIKKIKSAPIEELAPVVGHSKATVVFNYFKDTAI